MLLLSLFLYLFLPFFLSIFIPFLLSPFIRSGRAKLCVPGSTFKMTKLIYSKYGTDDIIAIGVFQRVLRSALINRKITFHSIYFLLSTCHLDKLIHASSFEQHPVPPFSLPFLSSFPSSFSLPLMRIYVIIIVLCFMILGSLISLT